MKRVLSPLVLIALTLALMSCGSVPQLRESGPTIAGYAVPPPAPTAAPAALGYPGMRDAYGEAAAPSIASADRMIVYTVNLSLEVKDTEKAVGDVTAIVSQYQGYIAAAKMARDNSGQMRGTLTLRVPADSLDVVQKQIEAVGVKVLSRNRDSNDVTDQFTDLNARLTNLQATEVELRELLTTTRERTGKAEDILAVYNRLTEVRGQIEQIKGQMNVLSKTSEMATVTIDLQPQVQVVAAAGWIPNETARDALRSLVLALQSLGDIVIWTALFILPLLVVLILPLIVLVIIVRAFLQRRNRRKAVAAA